MGSDDGVATGFPRPRPDIVTGTSIGAVNGAWLAQGDDSSMKELKDLWFGLHSNDNMFQLNEVFRNLVGFPGQPYGSTVAKILGDAAMSLAATFFIPFGFLTLSQVGNDVSTLYNHLNTQASVYNLFPLWSVLYDRERDWSPAGPGLRGAGVSVARDLVGHRIVFVRGYDDMLYVRWQLDGNPVSASTLWSSWRTPGEPISSDPVTYIPGLLGLSAENPLRVGVIARRANREGYGGRTLDNFNDVTHVDPVTPHYQPFQGWANVPPLPPAELPYCGQPTIVQRAPDGRAWAFCRNSHFLDPLDRMRHRSFYSRWEDLGWGSWTPFGQDFLSLESNVTGCSYIDGDAIL